MKKPSENRHALKACMLMGCLCLPLQMAAAQQSNKATPAVVEAAKRSAFEFEKRGAITYREVDGKSLNCDVYVPEGKGPFPAVLAIHGGAWRNGSKLAMLRHAWKLAQAGYVVVAINYRHAPESPFPAQIHDCKFAVRWMRANARQYKIDGDRIAAFGYSAGGHLAAMLGTTDKRDGLEPAGPDSLPQYSSRVAAVVAGGAPCEFDWIEDDANTLVYWLGAKKNENPEVYRRASPLSYVTSDDPPFYFYHGEFDTVVPKRTSCKLHDRLLECNVTSQHDVALNMGHVLTFSDLSWMTRAIRFLDHHLKTEPHPQ